MCLRSLVPVPESLCCDISWEYCYLMLLFSYAGVNRTRLEHHPDVLGFRGSQYLLRIILLSIAPF